MIYSLFEPILIEIGFQNFRRFEELAPIGLNPITFFVGENNSGKSTVVKGVLVLNDFLSSKTKETKNPFDHFDSGLLSREDAKKFVQQGVRLYFNSSYHTHIGTFSRALSKQAEEEAITFLAWVGATQMTITVKTPDVPEGADATYGLVSNIKLDYCYCGRSKQLSMELNLEEDIANVTFFPSEYWITGKTIESLWEKEPSEFGKQLKSPLTLPPIPISQNLGRIRWSAFFDKRSDIISYLVHSVELSIDAAINPTYEAVDKFLNPGDNTYHMPEQLPFGIHWAVKRPVPAEGIDEETKELLRLYLGDVGVWSCNMPDPDAAPTFALPVGQESYETNIVYIHAHEVAQEAIYSAKDANNYLALTIHEYASKLGKYKSPLVICWMQKFGIGRDFDIQSIGGEAHLCTITNLDGTQVDLSAKGMGSIQLMVLLLRLAISLSDMQFKSLRSMTFIVEEPEQNLHPSLQSLLADLFHEVHRDYGCRFIVETHSEYIIRRSQGIVCNNYNTENNPFRVYYFPADGQPYDMEYTEDGMFEHNFGDGFFNEAGRLHMQLLKSQRDSKEGRQDA